MNTDDDLKLISREELQLRFGLQPAFVKQWMEAKPELRCPFIKHGKTVPMFHAPTFMRWLIKHHGHGDWTGWDGKSEDGGRKPEDGSRRTEGGGQMPFGLSLTGKVGRPRAF